MQDITLTAPQPPTETTGNGSLYRIQAIERAMAILNAFTAEEPELRVSELADRLGSTSPRSTEFLVNLETAGLVERTPRTGRYRLGMRLFELGSLVLQRMDLWTRRCRSWKPWSATAARPAIWPCSTGRGDLHRAGRGPAGPEGSVGGGTGISRPCDKPRQGAAGLHRPRSAESWISERGLAAFTANTITDATQLRAELAAIRERGYAVDNEEYDEGLRCIGSPVWDHNGRVVAAVGIGGPVTRITPARIEELADLVMARSARPVSPARCTPIRGLHLTGGAAAHHHEHSPPARPAA